jgi:hypothetical protein
MASLTGFQSTRPARGATRLLAQDGGRAQQRETSAVKADRAGIWKTISPFVQPLVIAFLAALFALIVAHVNDVFRRPAG